MRHGVKMGVALTGGGRPHHLRGMTSAEPQEPSSTEETQVEGLEEHVALEESEHWAPPPAPRRDWRSVRNLWIAIGGLTFLLIVSMLVNLAPKKAALNADDPDLAAMRADLEMRRAELNRQRAELNLPPLAGQGEDVTAITTRLRKDAETLVSLVDRYQQLIADKDRALAEKNMDLIRSEQVRESLTEQLARVQTNTAGSARMQSELAEAEARAKRLADELTEARTVIAELFDNSPVGEIETLKRQLDEAVRARDFFKQRAEQLEDSARNGAAGFEEE
jgi:hypothetical protein